ncbi:MAG: mannose-6-phosphate isomerase-like protein (cupin superfamily) [Planctomycetota bacterium]|jgi:mannose-6-phosphate isomerase-like protein (cupin superfamily)
MTTTEQQSTLQQQRLVDQRLLKAVQQFGLDFDHPDLQAFKASLANWGSEWQARGQQYLAAADMLDNAVNLSAPATRQLLELFAAQKHQLRWEQSYKKSDAVVSDAMLNGYAFAEVVGLRGPFISDRIRCGIGVWGPHLLYPKHQHQAEEIYLVLGGSAEFDIEGNITMATAGSLLKVESLAEHGFQTFAEPLVVYYLWQSGNLREISRFIPPETRQ